MSKPLERDEERFRYLANEPPVVIPKGYSAPLDTRTTLEMMRDRDATTAQHAAGLRRGIEMLQLARGGQMVSFQNDEIDALLHALGHDG